ncbi:MAG TPA: hypothetical protein VGL61_36325 [Kofleriaceae bacterium]
MAVITFLLSLVVREANNLIQIVFGWSVTALFGKLRRRPQVLVTAALVLSLAWPLFVLGVFWPSVASWAIAFVPLHKLVGPTAMRIVWLSMAIAVPPLVGLLVHISAKHTRGSYARTMLAGYPIALGFFTAFVTVVITVPLVKLVSIARRWTDEHVFVQPRDGHYDAALEQLADAVRRAGLEPHTGDVPEHLVLATAIMRFMARGAVLPFVSPTLRRIQAPGIELYLYPADLLIRGKAETVAHVRALIMRTHLDACAYLVQSEAAQTIQDRFARIDQRITAGAASDAALTRELCACYRTLFVTDVPFDDVLALEALARRIERTVTSATVMHGQRMPLDAVGDDARAPDATLPRRTSRSLDVATV